VGVGVEAVIADHDLSFIRNMGGHTSDELQIVHPLFLKVSTEDDIGEDAQSTIVVKYPPGNIFNEKWCRGPDSNRHGSKFPRDFKSRAGVSIRIDFSPGTNIVYKGER